MPAGRKCKLTPELLNEACQVLRIGNYVKTTCGYLGVSEATWYSWINDGEAALKKEELGIELTDNETKKLEFLKSIKKAQDEAVVRNLQLIQTAAKSNWQAAAWTLERRYPAMFSLAQRITVTDKKEQLTQDDIKLKLEELKKDRNNKSIDTTSLQG